MPITLQEMQMMMMMMIEEEGGGKKNGEQIGTRAYGTLEGALGFSGHVLPLSLQAFIINLKAKIIKSKWLDINPSDFV